MIARLKKRLEKYPVWAGVEIYFASGSPQISYCILKRAKGDIDIVDMKEGITSFEELSGSLDITIPLNVLVDGRGVVSKSLDFVPEQSSKAALLKQVIPTAKAKDFYIQQSIIGNGAYLSLSRSEFIDSVVVDLEKLGYAIIEVSIGPMSTTRTFLLLNLNGHNDAIGVHNYIYRRTHEQVTEIGTTNGDRDKLIFEIEGIEIDSDLLPAFGVALQTVLGDSSTALPYPEFANKKDEYLYRRLFGLLGKGILAFFLTVLLLNFLVFSILQSRNDKLETQARGASKRISYLETLQNSVAEKEVFLTTHGWLRQSRTSLYADRLAGIMPKDITLSELIVHPAIKKSSLKENKSRFEFAKIVVRGESNNALLVNEWMRTIKYLEWTQQVELTFFNQESLNGSGEFAFEITKQFVD